MTNSATEKTYLYIPIEIKAREFHAKLLLALMAAEAGYRVVIGKQRELRRKLHALPAGIYLDKSVARSKERWFPRFRRLGNLVVAWDEEGLVIQEDQYIKSRFTRASFEQVAKFFAWGPKQGGILAAEQEAGREKIVLSGNPRFDMLRPEVRGFYEPGAQALREKHGPMILFNTNFGFYNHFKGVEDARRIFIKSSTHDGEGFIDDWIAFQKELFEHFVKILPWLSSAFPRHCIIVRPHPSENVRAWREAAGSLPNIKVIQEGNVLEWILASEAVLHSNCTTGIETYLLGVPSIAYRPVLSEKYETFLPNAVSVNVYTEEELRAVLLDIIDNENAGHYTHASEARAVADQYISAIDGKLACQVILEHLRQLPAPRTPCCDPLRLYQQLFDMVNALRHGLSRASGYDQQKFPGLTISEVKECQGLFSRVMGRFASVEVSSLGGTCYILEARGS